MLWADAISDLDFVITQKVAKQWVLTEKWPPTVAEIREGAGTVATPTPSTALQLCPPWEPRPDPTPEQMAANRAEVEKLIEKHLADVRRKKSSRVWAGTVAPDAPSPSQVAALESERKRQLNALQKAMDGEETA